MIRDAKKPYIFVGGGTVISGASEELAKFAEKVDAPVCDSLMGKGALTEPMIDTVECSECMVQKLPTMA